MKNRLIIALGLLILLTTYNPQKLPLITKFNIKEINIENNLILNNKEIKKDLTFLYDTNLIFLNNTNIKKILIEKSFVEKFEIKKIYPNKLIIKIFEKTPIAILQYKKEKYYIDKNIDLIDYRDLDIYKNLPVVFGSKENFENLYNVLIKINFPFNLIKKFYLYESKRWDLEILENKIIKLPAKDYVKSLENFMILIKDNSFDKYQSFDYRINNQLILK
tara:strand:+ start:63 stop:719 length:657 start_codon:yes stop_codon:yes gene_type:complete